MHADSGRRRSAGSPHSSSSSADASAFARRRAGQPVDDQRLGDDVADLMRGFSEAYGSWKTICMCRRQRRSSRPSRRVMSCAVERDRAGGRSTRRSIARPVVDLPEPDSPTSAERLPGAMSNDTPSTAWTTSFCAASTIAACEPDPRPVQIADAQQRRRHRSRARCQHAHARRPAVEPAPLRAHLATQRSLAQRAARRERAARRQGRSASGGLPSIAVSRRRGSSTRGVDASSPAV